MLAAGHAVPLASVARRNFTVHVAPDTVENATAGFPPMSAAQNTGSMLASVVIVTGALHTVPAAVVARTIFSVLSCRKMIAGLPFAISSLMSVTQMPVPEKMETGVPHVRPV